VVGGSLLSAVKYGHRDTVAPGGVVGGAHGGPWCAVGGGGCGGGNEKLYKPGQSRGERKKSKDLWKE